MSSKSSNAAWNCVRRRSSDRFSDGATTPTDIREFRATVSRAHAATRASSSEDVCARTRRFAAQIRADGKGSSVISAPEAPSASIQALRAGGRRSTPSSASRWGKAVPSRAESASAAGNSGVVIQPLSRHWLSKRRAQSRKARPFSVRCISEPRSNKCHSWASPQAVMNSSTCRARSSSGAARSAAMRNASRDKRTRSAPAHPESESSPYRRESSASMGNTSGVRQPALPASIMARSCAAFNSRARRARGTAVVVSGRTLRSFVSSVTRAGSTGAYFMPPGGPAGPFSCAGRRHSAARSGRVSDRADASG